MNTEAIKTVLVPGAWMGAWIWEPTAERLRAQGFHAEAITLRGLEPEQSARAIPAVRLEDHVQQLISHISTRDARPTVLVSHSYSAFPTALAADQLDTQVCGLVHFGGFLPEDGRSLLDGWGDSAVARKQERADIAEAGELWMPPERSMLDYETDLTPEDRDFLAERFTPHPGQTITEPARLSTPVAAQPSTYVALSLHGGEAGAWEQAPAVAKLASNWRRRHLRSGHWPMLSTPETTADLIAEEIRLYGAMGC